MAFYLINAILSASTTILLKFKVHNKCTFNTLLTHLIVIIKTKDKMK